LTAVELVGLVVLLHLVAPCLTCDVDQVETHTRYCPAPQLYPDATTTRTCGRCGLTWPTVENGSPTCPQCGYCGAPAGDDDDSAEATP